MKKIITALTLALVLTVTPISITFAQDSVDEILSDIQDERITKLEQQLVLSIPKITDNPNHVVSFTDPSKESVGVKLEIDGQGFVAIKSPYNLPSLGIGKHILTFRFTDNEDAVQNLEKELVVIPRPAVINAPDTVSKDTMIFTGTALAGSTVELFLSGNTLNEVATVVVEDTGDWTHTFEGDYQEAIYTIVAITTKNGIASSYSEPVVLELKNGGTVSVNSTDTISFSFKELFSSDVLQTAKDNIDLLWYGLITLLLGLGIGVLTMKLTNKKQSKDVQDIFTNSLNGTPKKEKEGEQPDAKNMSLREKFEQAGYNTTKKVGEEKKEEPKDTKEEPKVEEEPKEEVKKKDKKKDKKNAKEEKKVEEAEEPKAKEEEPKVEEEKKEEEPKTEEKETKEEIKKSVSKEEFLEEFKDEDPDDKKGKEKKSKKKSKGKKKKEEKMSKNIKIDLTSKN